MSELASIQADTLKILEQDRGEKARGAMLADKLIKKELIQNEWPERDFNFLRGRTLLVLRWLLERQDQRDE